MYIILSSCKLIKTGKTLWIISPSIFSLLQFVCVYEPNVANHWGLVLLELCLSHLYLGPLQWPFSRGDRRPGERRKSGRCCDVWCGRTGAGHAPHQHGDPAHWSPGTQKQKIYIIRIKTVTPNVLLILWTWNYHRIHSAVTHSLDWAVYLRNWKNLRFLVLLFVEVGLRVVVAGRLVLCPTFKPLPFLF